jgi:hypothetical protein
MKQLQLAAADGAKAFDNFNLALHDLGNEIASRRVLAAMAMRNAAQVRPKVQTN